LVFNGTWTQTATDDYHIKISPTITGDATTTHIIDGVLIQPTITAGANSQELYGLTIDGTNLATGGKLTTQRFALKLVCNSTSGFNGIHFVNTLATTGATAMINIDNTSNLTITSSSRTTLANNVSTSGDLRVGTGTLENSPWTVGAAGGVTSTGAQFVFAGATTVGSRVSTRDGTSQTLGIGVSATALLVASTSFITAASGTHALVASAVFNPMAFSSAGGAAVTNTSNVYINGNQSSVVTPSGLSYTLWAAGTGTNRLDGGLQLSYVAKTANYTATVADYLINFTANADTLTLPTAVGVTGLTYKVVNSGAAIIHVVTTSSQTFVNINAAPTTLDLGAVGAAAITEYTFTSNGANWLVTGKVKNE
jgi:hypothetical protein